MPGRVADLQGGLRLAEAVADGDAPLAFDDRDDLRVERLTGAQRLGRRHGERLQVRLDEHAPHGGRGAEAGHTHAVHDAHEGGRVEAAVVDDHDAGARDPRGEEVRPRVLRPAGRGDVEVPVAGLQAHPVHGRQVAHRVRGVGVRDHLRLRRGAGGEVQEQEVVPAGLALDGEVLGFGGGLRVQQVAFARPGDRALARGIVDDDAHDGVVDVIELGRVRLAGDDEARLPALGPILQVDRTQLNRRGQEHRAQADAREHRLPQLDLVVEHDHDVAAARHAGPPQEVRDLVGAAAQQIVGVDLLAAVLLDDPQRGIVVAAGQRIEPVDGEVEVLEPRPGERGTG